MYMSKYSSMRRLCRRGGVRAGEESQARARSARVGSRRGRGALLLARVVAHLVVVLLLGPDVFDHPLRLALRPPGEEEQLAEVVEEVVVVEEDGLEVEEEEQLAEEEEEEVVVVVEEEGWRWRRCGELRPPLVEQPLAAPAEVDGHVGADAHRLEKRALRPRG